MWPDYERRRCRWYSATCIINEDNNGSKESPLRCRFNQLSSTTAWQTRAARQTTLISQYAYVSDCANVRPCVCVCVCFPRERQLGTHQSQLCWNASSCAVGMSVTWEPEAPKWPRFPSTPPTSTRYGIKTEADACLLWNPMNTFTGYL